MSSRSEAGPRKKRHRKHVKNAESPEPKLTVNAPSPPTMTSPLKKSVTNPSTDPMIQSLLNQLSLSGDVQARPLPINQKPLAMTLEMVESKLYKNKTVDEDPTQRLANIKIDASISSVKHQTKKEILESASSEDVNIESLPVEMEDWTCSQVKTFLIGQGFDQNLATLLEKKEIDGKILKMIGQEDTLKDLHDLLGLQTGKLIFLRKIAKEYLAKESDLAPTMKTTTRENQRARQFGKDAGGLSYSRGALLPSECGSFDLNPAIEYKSCQNVRSKKDLEKRFIGEVAKFACACINQRCNGTIYFGVGDNKEFDSITKKSLYQHGEILGIQLTEDVDVGHVNDWLQIHFRASVPKTAKRFSDKKQESEEIRTCFSACLKTAIAIPVKDTNKVVIEVDVEPCQSFCKYLAVYFLDFDQKKKYYLRDGESSVEHNLTTIISKVRDNANRRHTFEHDHDIKDPKPSVKLSRIFCRNQIKLDDRLFKYVLLCNRAEVDDNPTVSQWIVPIKWKAIFNFDSNYGTKDSLYNQLHSAKDLLRKVSVILPNKEVDSCKSDLWAGSDLKWVQCVLPKNPMNPQLGFLQERNNIHKLIEQLIISQEKKDFVFLFALLSSDNLVEITDICLELCTRLQKTNQIVIIYTEDKHFNDFRIKLDQRIVQIEDCAVQLQSWQDFVTFVHEKTFLLSSDELRVPSASGIGVTVKKPLIQAFERWGMEILGINQCQNVELDNSKSLEYLRGGAPTWQIFHFNEADLPENMLNPLVKRDLTEKIIEQINSPGGKNVLVKLFKFAHEPGSGATTIAMSVLWNLRKEFRCVRIDTLEISAISDVAEEIIGFYLMDVKEDNVKQCRMLIFLDNSSDEKALALKKEIEKKSGLNKLNFRKALFTICYLVRHYDTRSTSQEEIENILGEPLFCLKQEPSPGELERLKEKLKQLEKSFREKDIPLKNMLHFVIMAENFDINSSYVKKVVNEALEDIGVYGKQETLLQYLAIVKYFGDKGLPSTHCHKFIDDIGWANIKNTERLMQILNCSPAKFFVCERTTDKSYKILEITHEPVAFQLLEKFFKYSVSKKALFEKVCEFLKEDFISHRFLQQDFHTDIREILVKRGPMAAKPNRQQFSRLISPLRDQSHEMAIALVELAFEKLDITQKPHLAQTLSRLHIKSKSFEKAVDWATTAIEFKDKFTFYDTRGQALKIKLRDMLGRNADVVSAVETACCAADNFQRAVKKFNEQKKKTFQQQSIQDLNVGFDLFSATTIMPALFGEIEVNNNILELLTQNLEKNNKVLLIRLLVEEDKFDLHQFFPNLNMTKDNHAFIKSIYLRTKVCISQATNIMNYDLNALLESKRTEHEEKLFKMIEKFEVLVGPENSNWRSLIEGSSEPDKNVLKSLLKYVRITTTQSIIYLFRNASAASIEEKLRLTQSIHSLIDKRADLNLSDEDKLCFIKLALAKLLGNLFKRFESITEQNFFDLELSVINYSKNLCEIGYDHSPEPYLFFLMLTWPFQVENEKEMIVSSFFNEIIFKKCLIKLSQFEEDIYRTWDPDGHTHIRKPQVQFFLKSAPFRSGIRTLTLKKPHDQYNGCYCATGVITLNNKGVTYQLPSGDDIEIRKAYLGREGISYDEQDAWQTQGLHKVSYNIGFTFGGPVAYNVEIQQLTMVDKIKQFQQD